MKNYGDYDEGGQRLIDALVEEVPSLTIDQATAVYGSRWLMGCRKQYVELGAEIGVKVGTAVGAAMGSGVGFEVGRLEGLLDGVEVEDGGPR